MRSRTWGTIAAAVVALFCASEAHAQVATFTSIKDAVPTKFFDSATTKPDPTNRNKLVIGFNSGFNATTLVANDFRASALAFSNRQATDTISFVVTAPAGYRITRITYTEGGTGFTSRTAISMGAATWVVAGNPFSLGVFTNDPTLSRTLDLTAARMSQFKVSITVSLFASTGSVAVTSANVLVGLAPM
jgi:hypothetical protein